MFILQNGVQFFLVNALLHFITDFFTSKASSSAYKEGNMKAFWGVIGFDQLIHHVTIMLLFVGFAK
jgi:ribosomal silencing factor RsfS